MPPPYLELDYQQTPMGDLMLRVRRSPSLDGAKVYEVKLNDEFLMSSVVTDSEVALAELALEAWGDAPCRVLVGGLGLGHTAAAALAYERVQHVAVIEALKPVIDWHERRLVPAADTLIDDPRCELIHDDFFKRIGHPPAADTKPYDLILLDIDHSPTSWLHTTHTAFYTPEGLSTIAQHLSPRGIFAIWSAERPDAEFLTRLEAGFASVEAHEIAYVHPMLHETERNAVVVAQL